MNTRMGMNITTWIPALTLALFLAGTSMALPVVENVRAAQRDDGSGIIDIHYDLSNGEGEITVTLDVSDDGGDTWNIFPDPQHLSGDIGPGVGNGTDRHIIWDMGADHPGVCRPQTRFQVIANDAAPEITIMLPGDVPLVMLRIPAGSFMRGRYTGEQDSYSNEDPQHQVTLTQDFYMGKYTVTKGQWQAVMGTRPWSGGKNVIEEPNSPVVYVSWYNAQDFITALNMHITGTGQGPAIVRLPTEAEWEYACRAGTTTRFYWGDDPSYTQIDDYAWHRGNAWDIGNHYAHVVGLKLPNAWDLYDMSGNVWEWCQDWYGNYPLGPVTDPTGPVSGETRVRRGGDWIGSGTFCRSAKRTNSFPEHIDDPDNWHGSWGFRVAAFTPSP